MKRINLYDKGPFFRKVKASFDEVIFEEQIDRYFADINILKLDDVRRTRWSAFQLNEKS